MSSINERAPAIERREAPRSPYHHVLVHLLRQMAGHHDTDPIYRIVTGFVSDVIAARAEGEGRPRAIAALNAVAKLVHDLEGPLDTDLAMMYVNLGRALTDLDRGAIHPAMLRPAKKVGRPAIREREDLRAIAALTLQGMAIATDLSQQQAAEAIAGALQRLGTRGHGHNRSIEARTVVDWLRECTGEKAFDDPQVITYRAGMNSVEPLFHELRDRLDRGTLTSDQVVQVLLERMARTIALLPAAKG
jgi:hypothetical protein